MTNAEKIQAALALLAGLSLDDIVGEIEFDLAEVPAPRSMFGSGGYQSFQVTVNFVEGEQAKKLKLVTLKKERAETTKYLYEIDTLIAAYERPENAAETSKN